ncbi:MAG: YggS family pyridoxal phosphate-dependent enzyme [Chitinophagaceae bacterium]|nr:MAG: YggS family pyridoxal phosphate-dependent enzyme [Chitinophagaceae bacterium]
MSINPQSYQQISATLLNRATLVAVSKTKPAEDIQALYDLGHRDFGENYVQELTQKYELLPKDIRWHFIGHLQSNKVKYIAPFVHLIHAVDSLSLLKEINKQAQKNNRVIDCLLQIYIAKEETKFGLDEAELKDLLQSGLEGLNHIRITGFMGMASFSNDHDLVRREFAYLKNLLNHYFPLIKNSTSQQISPISPLVGRPDGGESPTLSMGMSADYTIALEEGSNMVRIGSLLFGERNYPS